jgi:plastocyanin
MVAAALLPAALSGQSVGERSPNLGGSWTAPVGVIQFNFIHRFEMSDPPLRKLQNYPSFHVTTGVVSRAMVGFVWASNSDLVPRYPNEWEFFARARVLDEQLGAPVDVALQGGYNNASESIDGELLLARSFGPVRLLAAGRAFSEGYAGDSVRYALAGGARVRLTERVALAADWAELIDRTDDERPAWSAGVQLGVPYTPHSFSIQASNTTTATLEGASRGVRTRWGFEYTVPISIERYLPGGGSGDTGPAQATPTQGQPARAQERAQGAAAADTVVIDILNLRYGQPEITVAPGTVVVWTNSDPVQHTVTADDESFDSGMIDPDGRFAMTFDTPGRYPYHCIPHPFMTGTVIVSGGPPADASASRR